MDWKLRPYRTEDETFVYELKKECYYTYVSALWGWEEAAQKRYFQTFIQRAGKQMRIITANGTPIGMLNWGVPDESTFEIENLCLKPA